MADHTVTVESTLEALLVEKKYSTIRDILSTMNPADIASVFDGLEESRLPLLFRLLPKELAAETFVEMEPDAQELLIRGFSDSELREVLDELYVDDAVDIVEEMPANVVRRILSQADPDMRKDINEILRYPENSAGSIMTTEYVSLRPGMTVEEAILRIRRTGVDKETIYTCYVTKNRTLIGLVSVKDLLLAQDDDETVDKIMETNVISVHTHTDQEEVARMFSKYNFLALPVVDTENRMVGIVTFDDAMDVIAEEHQEDLQIAGVGSGDSASDDSTNVLSWFVHRQYWVVVWGIASCIMATVLGTALGSAHLVVFPMCAMPLVLLAASRMVSFVKNYFLEYDGHDDEPKPYLGFFFQSTGMGLILSLVTYLCAQLVRTAAFLDAPMFEEQLFTGCFNIAAIICLVGNMSAVIYLMVLFWRDEHDLNTSGTAMNVIAVMISCVAYCIAAVLLTMSVMG